MKASQALDVGSIPITRSTKNTKPNGLRARFNSDELRRSLRTINEQEAVRVARAMALKTDLVFEGLRAMGKKTKHDLIQAQMSSSYGKLPLSLEINRGQTV